MNNDKSITLDREENAPEGKGIGVEGKDDDLEDKVL